MDRKVSIVIPTYNERYNIIPLVNNIFEIMSGGISVNDGTEIIVVDDNSPDGTGQACQSLLSQCPSLKVVVRTNERGLGSAIMRGIMEATGETIVVMDADFSHDCAVIPKLVSTLDSDSMDIAIASRFVSGGKMAASFYHCLGSRMLNSFVRIVSGIPVRDTTGGFFAVKRTALEGLDFGKVFRGYGDYCIALLYKGVKKGWNIKEISFTYRPRANGSSKTRFFVAGFCYSIRALKLRLGLE